MKKKLVIVGVTGLVLAAAFVFVPRLQPDPLHAKARKMWKEDAIAAIAQIAADSNWVAGEVRVLKEKIGKGETDSHSWISDHLILLKDDEWIAYASKCSKEDSRIHDVFVGWGSNGKWYYSTYHFCIRMISLQIDEQPESLAKFVETYYLNEFDGRSDECLKKTWPPIRVQRKPIP